MVSFTPFLVVDIAEFLLMFNGTHIQASIAELRHNDYLDSIKKIQ